MEKEQSNALLFNVHEDDPNTISKDTADKYVSSWQSGKYSIVPSTGTASGDSVLQLDSFLFSIDDFKEYAARVDEYNSTHPDNQITGTICKLGIKANPIPGGMPAQVPGLFFEPVVGFKCDPLTPGFCKGDIQTSVRYDFSYPCPPTCAINH